MRFGWSLLAAAVLAAGASVHGGVVQDGAVVARIDAADRLLESLAADGERLFIGAVAQPGVLVRGSEGVLRDFVTAPLLGVLGLAVDGGAQRLWVATAGLPQVAGLAVADRGRAELVALDLARGVPLARYALPEPPGDVAVLADGSVLVSGAGSGAVYRLDRGATVLRAPPLGIALRSAQGIDAAADGRSAYVADYRSGIYRIDGDGRATLVAGTAPLRGIDGLTRIGNRLYAIINGSSPARVVRMTLAADGISVSDVTRVDAARQGLNEPTNGTAVAGQLWYIVNSGWPQFGTDGQFTPPLAPVIIAATR